MYVAMAVETMLLVAVAWEAAARSNAHVLQWAYTLPPFALSAHHGAGVHGSAIVIVVDLRDGTLSCGRWTADGVD